MRAGDVGVALSVLYQPFDEMDLSQEYGSPPRQSYFEDIRDQHQTVEDYVAARAGTVTIAHSPAELDSLIGGCVPILVHAVEGGFQLGRDPVEGRRNVRELAGLGVAYVTLAHLFFRGVATNAPALPFLPDGVYNWVFSQPHGEGLTPLGVEAVEARIDEGILIDITHMRSESIRDVFKVLDARGIAIGSDLDGYIKPALPGHRARPPSEAGFHRDSPVGRGRRERLVVAIVLLGVGL
jgi:microsomal dipeptidase-like Zn-dependent dipeptidase